jgi:hypothetical protein
MNLAGWLSAVEKIAPIALALTPLAPIAPFVGLGIKLAEQIQGADSATKLAVATQIVNVGIQATNTQAGKVIVDPTVVNQALQSGIGTVVAVANLIHKNSDPAPVK